MGREGVALETEGADPEFTSDVDLAVGRSASDMFASVHELTLVPREQEEEPERDMGAGTESY